MRNPIAVLEQVIQALEEEVSFTSDEWSKHRLDGLKDYVEDALESMIDTGVIE